MYAYIKGKLAMKHDDYLVVEAGGIGYRVHTAMSTISAAGSLDSEITVYTHLHVREDIMSLYGFVTQEELGMFELLISVSGVGPKAAAAVLSAISPSRFGLAIITDDARSLTRAQGIGLKTAQRIILELKDKIKKEQLQEAIGGKMQTEGPADGSGPSEAVSALMVLGYTYQEASRAVAAVYTEGMDLESIIKNALKSLVR